MQQPLCTLKGASLGMAEQRKGSAGASRLETLNLPIGGHVAQLPRWVRQLASFGYAS